MAKVVYNTTYGGFSLSRAAILRAREISGNSNWGAYSIAGDIHPETGDRLDKDYGNLDGVARHDPVLVQVVEELGESASNWSELGMVEIPDGSLYRICSYDGLEWVETPDSIEWVSAK